MKDMTDVTARFPRSRGTGKQIFRDDDGSLWVVEREFPDDPLNAEPLKTSLDVSRFLLKAGRRPNIVSEDVRPF